MTVIRSALIAALAIVGLLLSSVAALAYESAAIRARLSHNMRRLRQSKVSYSPKVGQYLA